MIGWDTAPIEKLQEIAQKERCLEFMTPADLQQLVQRLAKAEAAVPHVASNATRVSDERLAELDNSACDQLARHPDGLWSAMSAEEAHSVFTELQSLRSLPAQEPVAWMGIDENGEERPFRHEVTARLWANVGEAPGGSIRPLSTILPKATAPVVSEPVATKLPLDDLICSLDGMETGQPGFEYRKGWNAAVMYCMDLQRALASPQLQPKAVTEDLVERVAQWMALDHVSISDRAEYSWDATDDLWKAAWRKKARSLIAALQDSSHG